MTKYELSIVASYDHGNGYIDKKREKFYSSYVAHLLKKYELFKQDLSWDWKIQVNLMKIENIRTMTLDEIGLHINNDQDCILICSFKDEGVQQN